MKQKITLEIRLLDKATDKQLRKYREILNRAVDRVLREGDKNEIAMAGEWAKVKNVKEK